MYLIELAFAIEERKPGDHLEEYTAVAPYVHFTVIVSIGHEAFWCSIPSGGDVLGVGLFGVDALT